MTQQTINYDNQVLTIDVTDLTDVSATVGSFLPNRSADRDPVEALEQVLDFLGDATVRIAADARILDATGEGEHEVGDRVAVDGLEDDIDWEWAWVTFDDAGTDDDVNVVDYLTGLILECDLAGIDLPAALPNRATAFGYRG